MVLTNKNAQNFYSKFFFLYLSVCVLGITLKMSWLVFWGQLPIVDLYDATMLFLAFIVLFVTADPKNFFKEIIHHK
jgi:hypothetical protein